MKQMQTTQQQHQLNVTIGKENLSGSIGKKASITNLNYLTSNTTISNWESRPYIKIVYGDQIDLIDTDGNTKEIYTVNTKNYAIQYLNPTTTYIVVKIENSTDPSATNEKKFIPLVNENFLNANIMKTLATLNTGKNLTAKDKAKLNREAKQKQQQQQQLAAASGSQQTGTSMYAATASNTSTNTAPKKTGKSNKS